METLNIDTLSTILTYTPYELVNIISSPDPLLLQNINRIRENNSFWKKRAEILFGKKLSPRQTNWKIVYENIIEALTNKIDDNIQPVIYSILVLGYNKFITDIISVLLEAGYDPSYNINQPIFEASSRGHIHIVKILLQDPRVDPSDAYNEPIRITSSKGYTDIVKLLLQDARVDPSDLNNRAIRQASSNGYTEIVKILLQDSRVDPSVNNNQAIQNAAKKGYKEIVKMLLQDLRVNPSANNNEAIKIASEKGYKEIVNLLLQADVLDKAVIKKLSLHILKILFLDY